MTDRASDEVRSRVVGEDRQQRDEDQQPAVLRDVAQQHQVREPAADPDDAHDRHRESRDGVLAAARDEEDEQCRGDGREHARRAPTSARRAARRAASAPRRHTPEHDRPEPRAIAYSSWSARRPPRRARPNSHQPPSQTMPEDEREQHRRDGDAGEKRAHEAVRGAEAPLPRRVRLDAARRSSAPKSGQSVSVKTSSAYAASHSRKFESRSSPEVRTEGRSRRARARRDGREGVPRRRRRRRRRPRPAVAPPRRSRRARRSRTRSRGAACRGGRSASSSVRIFASSHGSSRSRRPRKRVRTPCFARSGSSPSIVSERSSSRSATSSGGPRPVLGRERVDDERLDPEVDRRLDRPAQRPRAGAVTLRDGQPAGLGPAAVSVHDDRDDARLARRRAGEPGVEIASAIGVRGSIAERDQTSMISASLCFRSSSIRLRGRR